MKSAFIRIGRYGLRIILAALSLLGIAYLLLLTPFGNTLLKPLIEKKLQSSVQSPISIDTFILTHDTLHLHFHDTLANNIDIQGKFSLITLNLHALYQADLLHTGGLNTFKLPLKSYGVINGGYGMMMLQGSANIFGGDFQYRLGLNRFHPSDLHLFIININYQNLMQWLEYPHTSSTLLSGEVNLHGLDHRDVEGYAALHAKTKNFSPSVIIDDNSSFDFLSLFTDKQGKIQPFHLNVNLDASLNELGILEQFAGIPLRGNADLKCTLQGDQDRLVLDAQSNIAKSSTHARLHWKRLRPSYVYLNVDHADAATLFHIFSLASPIEGNIHLNAESNITDTTANLTLLDGVTHPDIFKQEYSLTQPKEQFTASLSLKGTQKIIRYRGKFTSDLARLNIDNTTTHEYMLHDLLKAIP